MKRRRESDEGPTTLVVTTSDGHRFRCSISAIGHEDSPHWVLLDVSGAQYMGPAVTSDRTPDAVTRQVEEWWQSRGSLATRPKQPTEQAEVRRD
jgi:hypothetical protein